MKASISLSVKCLVKGLLHGEWEELSKEFSLTKGELEDIASTFVESQKEYDSFRISVANRMKKGSPADRENAKEYAKSRCQLCDSRIVVYGGLPQCSCYRKHGAGKTVLVEIQPDRFLAEFSKLGGKWEDRKWVGAEPALTYANRRCYEDSCVECGAGFYVRVGDVMKVTLDIAKRGTGDSYVPRKLCFQCKGSRLENREGGESQNLKQQVG